MQGDSRLLRGARRGLLGTRGQHILVLGFPGQGRAGEGAGGCCRGSGCSMHTGTGKAQLHGSTEVGKREPTPGAGTHRDRTVTRGDSLGLCLLRLIQCCNCPTGLLATACPGPAVSREDQGAPASTVLQPWLRGAPGDGSNASKHRHPLSEQACRGHGHLPPTLTAAPQLRALQPAASPARSRGR